VLSTITPSRDASTPFLQGSLAKLGGRFKDLRSRFGSTALGASFIVLLWIGIAAKYIENRANDLAGAESYLKNICLLLKDSFQKSIDDSDKSIRFLRLAIERTPEPRDYNSLISVSKINNASIIQMAIIDANGVMRASSAGPQPAPAIDLSDRDHYRVHIGKLDDELFISKPVIGRVSDKVSLQLSRHFLNSDKTFGGVVVASLDPKSFESLAQQIDLGSGASFSLVGTDGFVRASGGDSRARYAVGDVLTDSESVAHFNSLRNGAYWDSGVGHGGARLAYVQGLDNQPVTVTAAMPKTNVFANSQWHLLFSVEIGFILTILIGAATYQARQSEFQTHQNAQALQLTLDHMTQGIMMVTKDLRIPIINRKCLELLDLPMELMDERPRFDELVRMQEERGEFSNTCLPHDQSALAAFGPNTSTGQFELYERQRPNGTVLEVRSTRLADGGFVRTFSDITRRQQAQAQVARLASEDALTSLANRRVWNETLERFAVTSDRRTPSSFAVLYLDLDNFKVVNDTQGHAIGDKLLQAVAGRLRNLLRDTDVIARLGGDEFAILLQPTLDTGKPEIVADRLVSSLGRPYDIDGQQLLISVSIGIAIAPQHGHTVNDLQIAADLALYSAKAAGRSTYRTFASNMIEQLQTRRRIETELREAIVNDELALNYQPIIDLQHDTLSGFEALARWTHPTLGAIAPDSFIPIAEDCGLINVLGAWVLREACRQATNWPEEMSVAVNLSPLQFTHPGLVAMVDKILRDTGLSPSRLELEITERLLIRNSDDTIATLHQLRKLGVRIAMDDFGTGYSSLSYLQRFPFNRIKIDRSFVSRLGTDTASSMIVQAVASISKCLNMQTTAEGVETVAQQLELKMLGCNNAQGYLFGRPVPHTHVPAIIGSWTQRVAKAS
jgi:diguanylate cyclase (GGDEF)-like protein